MLPMRRKKPKKLKKPAFILRLAHRLGYQPGRVMKEVLEWVEVLAVAGALAVVIMSFVTVRMHVPTESMVPIIEPKDSFFVDRITYYFRDPVPGDIVVFWHTDRVLIRSVDASRAPAGLSPGDRLLAINNQQIYSAKGAEAVIESLPAGTEIVLQVSGAPGVLVGTKSREVQSLADLGVTLRERRMRYVKRLIAVGGQTVHLQDDGVYVDGERLTGPAFDRFYASSDPRMSYGVTPTEVPSGHWFVLGDNTFNSWDSRYWGFVDERDFIGEPFLRVWPLTRFGLMNNYFGVGR
jgi:signal peptidase I